MELIKNEELFLLKQSWSDGSEEPDDFFPSAEDAWDAAKRIVLDAICESKEEIGVTVFKEIKTIILRYADGNAYSVSVCAF